MTTRPAPASLHLAEGGGFSTETIEAAKGRNRGAGFHVWMLLNGMMPAVLAT